MTTFNDATGLAEGSFGVGTYETADGKSFPGLVLPDGTVFDVSDSYHDTHAVFADWDRAVDGFNDLADKRGKPELRFDDLKPLPVVAHPNMLCAGSNYAQHVAEMMTHNKFNQENREPGESDESFFARNLAEVNKRSEQGMPFFWTGLHSSLAGANDDIILPLIGEHPDWELELGVITKNTGRDFTPEEAGDKLIAAYVNWAELGGNFMQSMMRPWNDLPTAVISFGHPFYLIDIPRVPCAINAYASMDTMQSAVVDCLLGRSPFVGTSPVDPTGGVPDAIY